MSVFSKCQFLYPRLFTTFIGLFTARHSYTVQKDDKKSNTWRKPSWHFWWYSKLTGKVKWKFIKMSHLAEIGNRVLCVKILVF